LYWRAAGSVTKQREFGFRLNSMNLNLSGTNAETKKSAVRNDLKDNEIRGLAKEL